MVWQLHEWRYNNTTITTTTNVTVSGGKLNLPTGANLARCAGWETDRDGSGPMGQELDDSGDVCVYTSLPYLCFTPLTFSTCRQRGLRVDIASADARTRRTGVGYLLLFNAVKPSTTIALCWSFTLTRKVQTDLQCAK